MSENKPLNWNVPAIPDPHYTAFDGDTTFTVTQNYGGNGEKYYQSDVRLDGILVESTRFSDLDSAAEHCENHEARKSEKQEIKKTTVWSSFFLLRNSPPKEYHSTIYNRLYTVYD